MPKKKRRPKDHLRVVLPEDTAGRSRFRRPDQYIEWFGAVIEGSGGALDGPLRWDYVTDAHGNLKGLILYRQKLHFGDGTVLIFRAFVTGDAVCAEYSFHYQTEAGDMIWRLDKHPGHRRSSLTHVHDNPKNPKHRAPFREVDVSEVLALVYEYQRSGVKPR